MKRRLDLACALVHQPRIVFLDEPTTGLDPITREQVWRHVTELNRQGVTFFLTTQYLEEADRLAHNIAIMDAGRIVAQGSPEQLKASIAADAITLTFDHDRGTLEAAASIARQFEGVEDVQITDRDVIVYIRNGAAAVAEIIRRLDDAGLSISRLGLKHPSLDDVFLRTTGHELEVDEKPRIEVSLPGAQR